MTTWPWPDTRLDRRTRVAAMYRAALHAADPAAADELDQALHAAGQHWLFETPDIPVDQLLTAADIAELTDLTPDAIRHRVHRGQIQRCGTNSRGAALYRWADVLGALKRPTRPIGRSA